MQELCKNEAEKLLSTHLEIDISTNTDSMQSQ
jgi:hypothetical protein